MTTEPCDCFHTYQDLVLEGQTVVPGTRDCLSRWEILEPYLPRRGSVLDVGSNMGWFGWMISREFPDSLVASIEPDEQSANLQRQMLHSHRSKRICLLTARANANTARVFVQAGQRFDAMLCLSVLHWLPEHRQFLSLVGSITRRILVEQPDPRETGAGFERVRTEIGPIGLYLQSLFPERPVRRLAQLASHRSSPYPREIWLVDARPGSSVRPSRGLDVEALLALSPGWPPRDWWLDEFDRWAAGSSGHRRTSGRLLLVPCGLEHHEDPQHSWAPGRLRRRLARLPQDRLLTRYDSCYRRVRHLGGTVLRGLHVLKTP